MVPLFKDTTNANREDEAKYVQTFHRIEIGTGFYFSYTYDLTRSLQENMMRKIRNKQSKDEPILTKIAEIYARDFYSDATSNPSSKSEGGTAEFMQSMIETEEELKEYKPWDNSMMWNYFLMREFYESIKRKKWIMPVIRGYID